MTQIIKPLGDRVAVKILPADKTTSTGLVRPDVAQERIVAAEVIAIGPGYYSEHSQDYMPMAVAVGDKVRFVLNNAFKMPKREGIEEYFILRQHDIIEII